MNCWRRRILQGIFYSRIVILLSVLMASGMAIRQASAQVQIEPTMGEITRRVTRLELMMEGQPTLRERVTAVETSEATNRTILYGLVLAVSAQLIEMLMKRQRVEEDGF